MKVGDLVMHKKKKDQEVDHRSDWGFGYIIEVHRTMYKNHVPFVSVFWPSWKKTTKGSQVYLEVVNEN